MSSTAVGQAGATPGAGLLLPRPGAQAANEGTTTTGVRRSAELERVARDFEAIFLRQLLAPMASSLGQAGGGRVYGSMLVGAMADTASEGGGIGLAEVLTRALLPVAESGQQSPARLGAEGAAAPGTEAAERRAPAEGAETSQE